MAGCSGQFGSGGKAAARDLSTLRADWVTLHPGRWGPGNNQEYVSGGVFCWSVGDEAATGSHSPGTSPVMCQQHADFLGVLREPVVPY